MMRRISCLGSDGVGLGHTYGETNSGFSIPEGRARHVNPFGIFDGLCQSLIQTIILGSETGTDVCAVDLLCDVNTSVLETL